MKGGARECESVSLSFFLTTENKVKRKKERKQEKERNRGWHWISTTGKHPLDSHEIRTWRRSGKLQKLIQSTTDILPLPHDQQNLNNDITRVTSLKYWYLKHQKHNS